MSAGWLRIKAATAPVRGARAVADFVEGFFWDAMRTRGARWTATSSRSSGASGGTPPVLKRTIVSKSKSGKRRQLNPGSIRAAMLGALFGSLLALARTRSALVFENMALRQQLAVYKRELRRPKVRFADRAFWTLLSRLWIGWREALHFVKPATVLRWHRDGFSRFWRWRLRRRTGRPPIPAELRALITDGLRKSALGSTPGSTASFARWASKSPNELSPGT